MKTTLIVIGVIILIIIGVVVVKGGNSMSNAGNTASSTVTGTDTNGNLGSSDSNNASNNASNASGSATYNSNGISFTYPDNWKLANSEQAWTNVNSTSTGTVLARVSVQANYMPKTNFSEAWFQVGYSTNATDVKNCTAKGNATDAGKVTINGITYEKITANDAGAGNLYDTTSYRAVKDAKCYAIEYTIHSTNIGNYDPSQGISEFNKSSVTNTLESIAKSFKFI